jgi:hypothetical protein
MSYALLSTWLTIQWDELQRALNGQQLPLFEKALPEKLHVQAPQTPKNQLSPDLHSIIRCEGLLLDADQLGSDERRGAMRVPTDVKKRLFGSHSMRMAGSECSKKP